MRICSPPLLCKNEKVRLHPIYTPGRALIHVVTPDIIHALLASLPRSRLAGIQRKLMPMLLLDVVGVRPTFVFSKGAGLKS